MGAPPRSKVGVAKSRLTRLVTVSSLWTIAPLATGCDQPAAEPPPRLRRLELPSAAPKALGARAASHAAARSREPQWPEDESDEPEGTAEPFGEPSAPEDAGGGGVPL
jgi:hypothetical protein